MICKRSRADVGVLVNACEPQDLTAIEESMRKGSWGIVNSALKGKHVYLKSKQLRSFLSLALAMEAPEEVIKTIISVSPESVNEEDKNGRLPIHLSCLFGASPEIIRRILESDPTSAMRKDRDGRVALHYAVQYCVLSKGDTQETVEVLCAFAPRAAHTRDLTGLSPTDLVDDMSSKAENENDFDTAYITSEISWIMEGCSSSW
mmetsp:Transcript_47307/g.143262  ORF Transcript_47307/g.143262 Transcript_47307/m.143262 type:complete len:204 (-) Transcript_47307:64-675(-)